MIAKGRPARVNPVEGVRALTREDLALIKAPRTEISTVKKLKSSHHNLARLIAAGLSHVTAAERAGYSAGGVHLLMKDPSFISLVTHYQGLVTERFLDTVDTFAELAVSNMVRAERMISDHLDEADETNEPVPLNRLIPIVTDRADRFGYGKKSTQVNVNVDFASKLEQANRRSRLALESHPKVIEGTVIRRRA